MKCEVTFWPAGRTVHVRRGTTLLDAARQAGIPISTRCGGRAACFMCKVKVRPGSELLPIGEQEKRKLAGLCESGTRLACQAKAAGRAEVDVPDDPLRLAVLKQLAKQKEEDEGLW